MKQKWKNMMSLSELSSQDIVKFQKIKIFKYDI